MDGLTAVVEHMDLRQVQYGGMARCYRMVWYGLGCHGAVRCGEVRCGEVWHCMPGLQEETGHWDSAACPDYVDIRTEVAPRRKLPNTG